MPLLALALTVVLCAVPVAQVADVLRASGLSACTPVVLLHSLGYALGYMLPRLLGFNEKTARTGKCYAVACSMQSLSLTC
jgi:predicted Na+-dependent transporter